MLEGELGDWGELVREEVGECWCEDETEPLRVLLAWNMFSESFFCSVCALGTALPAAAVLLAAGVVVGGMASEVLGRRKMPLIDLDAFLSGEDFCEVEVEGRAGGGMATGAEVVAVEVGLAVGFDVGAGVGT